MSVLNLSKATKIELSEIEITLPLSVNSGDEFDVKFSSVKGGTFAVALANYRIGRTGIEDGFFGYRQVVLEDKQCETHKMRVGRPGVYAVQVQRVPNASGPPLKFDADKAHVLIIVHGPNAACTQSALALAQDNLSKAESWENREIRQQGYTGNKAYIVTILLEGCLLDHKQRIEGGWIAPLSFGLKPLSNIDLANRLLKPKNKSFPVSGEFASDFERAHPVLIAQFSNVAAQDENAAISTLSDRHRILQSGLGIDRGSTPRPAGYICQEHGTTDASFILPSVTYRGNLVGGFTTGAIATFTDEILEAQQLDDWIGLAASLIAEAIAERSPDFRIFKAWSVIEASSKRKVTRSNTNVFDDSGNPIQYRGRNLTQNNDLGRVITYLRDVVKGVTRLNSSGEIWTPTDQILQAYLLRNIVGHEGKIVLPAVIDQNNRHFLFYKKSAALSVVEWAQRILRYESLQLTNFWNRFD